MQKSKSKSKNVRIPSIARIACVLDGEPRLDEYFERLDPDPTDQPSNENLQPSFEAHGFENGVKVHADMAVQMTDQGKSLVIDFPCRYVL